MPDTPLVAACPVSVRGADDAAPGNKVSAMFASLDTQLDDPLERIRAIQACTVGAKEEHQAVGADMLQNWAEYAAPNTFNLASRLYSSWGLADSHRPDPQRDHLQRARARRSRSTTPAPRWWRPTRWARSWRASASTSR